MNITKLLATATVCSCLVLPMVSQAQSIGLGLQHYERQEYAAAVSAFYDVLQHDRNASHRDQAQIYMAESLQKMHLYTPALFYYMDLFKAGRRNRYYINAVQGLLQIQQALHDSLLVPSVIDENFDPRGFSKLSAAGVAQINYLIGQMSFRRGRLQDAKAFLEYVAPTSDMYPHSLYLRGLIAVRQRRQKTAIQQFKSILKVVNTDSENQEWIDVRNMAIVALAQLTYGQGDYEASSRWFEQIPRYSDAWFKALYEDAWAQYKQGRYGKALGRLQSVTAPYFSKQFIPEAFIIEGTTYFANCQWDRVRHAVQQYQSYYEPMLSNLNTYLKHKQKYPAYYLDVIKTGNAKFAPEVARKIRKVKRFKDFHFMMKHMAWEQNEIQSISVWKDSRLSDDLKYIVQNQRKEVEQVVGQWTKKRLQMVQASLLNYQSQINILDFEITDAERRWLEEGREILKGRRARAPRPKIISDQWQHWKFAGEYWKGESGFLQHSLRSECM